MRGAAAGGVEEYLRVFPRAQRGISHAVEKAIARKTVGAGASAARIDQVVNPLAICILSSERGWTLVIMLKPVVRLRGAVIVRCVAVVRRYQLQLAVEGNHVVFELALPQRLSGAVVDVRFSVVYADANVIHVVVAVGRAGISDEAQPRLAGVGVHILCGNPLKIPVGVTASQHAGFPGGPPVLNVSGYGEIEIIPAVFIGRVGCPHEAAVACRGCNPREVVHIRAAQDFAFVLKIHHVFG